MRIVALLLVGLLVVASGCLRQEYRPEAEIPFPSVPAYTGGWASVDEATIRPGVRVLTPTAGGGAAECTSNFLFRTPDNATLYLGVAAHCFGSPSDAAPIGTEVDIVPLDSNAPISRAARIAYNGWALDPADRNDFGLVELRNDAPVRGKVNPAMMHFGGPTGIANAADVTPGTHVITYGHSIQRASDDPENPREGYVLEHSDGRTTVVTNHPGIQGDSGSGSMTLSGLAVGVLSMGTTNPTDGAIPNRDFPSVNFYVDLDQALLFAMANGDPALRELEIVTAPLLNGAVLPL